MFYSLGRREPERLEGEFPPPESHPNGSGTAPERMPLRLRVTLSGGQCRAPPGRPVPYRALSTAMASRLRCRYTLRDPYWLAR